MRLNKKFIALLFFLSFFVNAIVSYSLVIKWWDETVYANLGYYLQKHFLDYSFHGWGDRVSVWEGKAGFRPPLLPYILAVIDFFSNSNQLFVDLLIPFIGAVGIVILYLFSKKVFDEKTAIYSSLLLTFLPVYVIHAGKILTDVLATVLVTSSFLSFWIGFEKKITKFKYLTGFLVGLSVLAKYTSLIIIPAFFLYFLFRKRNLDFLKDRDLAISFLIVLLTLSPLLVYGYFSYGTPLGPFIHGWIGGYFSGGFQSWYFFFMKSFTMFSIVAIMLVVGFYSTVKFWKKPNNLLILSWFVIFLLFFSSLVHKDVRFFLPLAPAVCVLASLGIQKFGKFKNFVFILVLVVTLISTFTIVNEDKMYYDSKPVWCFFQSTTFLKNSENNSFVFTENSPLVYYYTHRQTDYYTNVDGSIKKLDDLVKKEFSNRTVYVLWTFYANPVDIRPLLKNDTNFKSVFTCPEDSSLAQVYEYIR